MKPTLRPYQDSAARHAWHDLASGRSPLIEAATGTGKSTTLSQVAAWLVQSDPRHKILVLAPRREIIAQLTRTLGKFGLSVTHDLRKYERASVVVCSPASCRARMRDVPPNTFSLVIADEAHHAPAPGWFRTIQYFRSGGAKLLGMTATPDRADGVSLGLLFDSVTHRYDIALAVAEGYLVPANGVRVMVEGLDLRTIRTKEYKNQFGNMVRDLHQGDLGRVMMNPAVVEGITGPLVELSKGRKTVVFAVNRDHAAALRTSLLARGVGASLVDGSMKKDDRDTVLLSYEHGMIQYLVNVMLLTEGWDSPETSCVAMCRPTESRTLYTQMSGRCLRLFPDKTDGLILDFTGDSDQLDLAGPENCLGDALLAPVKVIDMRKKLGVALQKEESKSNPPPPVPARVRSYAVPAPYVPPATGWVKFTTRVVQLIRGAKRWLNS